MLHGLNKTAGFFHIPCAASHRVKSCQFHSRPGEVPLHIEKQNQVLISLEKRFILNDIFYFVSVFVTQRASGAGRDFFFKKIISERLALCRSLRIHTAHVNSHRVIQKIKIRRYRFFIQIKCLFKGLNFQTDLKIILRNRTQRRSHCGFVRPDHFIRCFGQVSHRNIVINIKEKTPQVFMIGIVFERIQNDLSGFQCTAAVIFRPIFAHIVKACGDAVCIFFIKQYFVTKRGFVFCKIASRVAGFIIQHFPSLICGIFLKIRIRNCFCDNLPQRRRNQPETAALERQPDMSSGEKAVLKIAPHGFDALSGKRQIRYSQHQTETQDRGYCQFCKIQFQTKYSLFHNIGSFFVRSAKMPNLIKSV